MRLWTKRASAKTTISTRKVLDGSDVSSDDGFDDDLAMLEGYSFVSFTTDASVHLNHGLVQLATGKWLESQCQLERGKERYIGNLGAVLPPGSYENSGVCRVFFPHAKSTVTLTPQEGEALVEWAMVMYNAAWCAWCVDYATEAEKMATRSLKVRVGSLGRGNETTLSSMAMLALAKKAAGN